MNFLDRARQIRLQGLEISRQSLGFRHDHIITAWAGRKILGETQGFFETASDAVSFNRPANALCDSEAKSRRSTRLRDIPGERGQLQRKGPRVKSLAFGRQQKIRAPLQPQHCRTRLRYSAADTVQNLPHVPIRPLAREK